MASKKTDPSINRFIYNNTKKQAPSHRVKSIANFDSKFLKVIGVGAIIVSLLVLSLSIFSAVDTRQNLRVIRFSVTSGEDDYLVGVFDFDIGRRKIAWKFLNLDEDGDPTRRPDFISLKCPDDSLVSICGSAEEGSQVCKLIGEKLETNDGQSLKPKLKELRVDPHLFSIVFSVRNDTSVISPTYSVRLLNSVGNV